MRLTTRAISLAMTVVLGVGFPPFVTMLAEHYSKPKTPGITGRDNIVIGKAAAMLLSSGSYNLCIGDHSCPDLSTQSCVVDVRGYGAIQDAELSTGIIIDWKKLEKVVERVMDKCPANADRDQFLLYVLFRESVPLPDDFQKS